MIKVCLDRKLILDEDYIGTVTENGQPLTFSFPEELQSYTKSLIIDNGESFVLPFVSNTVTLDSDVTGQVVKMQVKCVLGAKVWKSKPYEVYFYDSIDDTGNNQTQLRLVSELADALTDNFGHDYSGKTWAELVGTYGEYEYEGGTVISDDEESETVPTHNYHYLNGALFELRKALKGLYDYVTPDFQTASMSLPPPCFTSIESVKSCVDRIKALVVTALNETLEPEKPLALDANWYDVTEMISELPSSVDSFVTASVGTAEGQSRLDLETALDSIIAEYNLEGVCVFGNWQADLITLSEVCDAIYSKAESEMLSPMVTALYGFYNAYA